MKTKALFLILASLMLPFFSCQTRTPKEPPQDEQEEMIPLEDVVTTAEAIPAATRCGEEEVDPETGERTVLPRVDLIISNVEIADYEDGVRITPTIKNLCDEDVSGDVEVSLYPDIRRDMAIVISMAGIPGLGERVGPTVMIPRGATYTLTVDWNRSIDEANEGNNTCRVSGSGPCGE